MSTRLSSYRDLIALSAPIAGIQFAQVALTSTDLLMMGLLGVQAVAAGGLAMLLYNQLRTMCVGMVTGVGNLIAAAVGRGEKRAGTPAGDDLARAEVQVLLRSALLVATLTGAVAALLLVGLSLLLPLLGQTPEVAAQAQAVMLTLAPGLVPMLWLNVLRHFAVGLRRAGSLLRVTLLSIAVNALLNAVFIYGWLGLPQLGLAGIGLSTTLVQVWTFLVYLRTVRRDPVLGPLAVLDLWRADREKVLSIARMGTPIALTYGSEAAITSIASLFMGSFGAVTLAASNIVNQLAYIVYQVSIGLSQGASILVSRALGKGEAHAVAPVAGRALGLGLGVMTAVGLLYVLVPSLVLRPFLGIGADPAVMAMAQTLLWFAIVHQYSKGSQNICVGLLRGVGNTKAGLHNTLIGYWLIGVPAMAVCAYPLGLDGYGVWFGLCLGFTATSLLLWRRFLLDLNALTGPARDRPA